MSNSGKKIERETIKQFKADDMSAFDIIYRKYSKKLYRFAYSIIKVKPDAEGIVHEVFIKKNRDISRFSGSCGCGTTFFI